MVGVVGSSPIAPTKQNPLCWAVWKGSPKGGPFFVRAIYYYPKIFLPPPKVIDPQADRDRKSLTLGHLACLSTSALPPP
ncbi:hypothetical protein EMIT0357P_120104 [Pseudomonas marginalis]